MARSFYHSLPVLRSDPAGPVVKDGRRMTHCVSAPWVGQMNTSPMTSSGSPRARTSWENTHLHVGQNRSPCRIAGWGGGGFRARRQHGHGMVGVIVGPSPGGCHRQEGGTFAARASRNH